MSDVYVGKPPSGRKLESVDARNTAADFGVLLDATDEVIEMAKRFWPQVSPDDYEIRERHWVHRETGEEFRVATHRVLDDDPSKAGIVSFV